MTIIKDPTNPIISNYKNVNFKKYKKTNPFYQANISFPAMSRTFNSATIVCKDEVGSESETALEALDGYLETLEIIRRQPRIDQWKVNRVS